MLRVPAFIPIALAGSLILVGCSSPVAPSEEFPGLEYYTDFASYEAQVEWSRNRHRAVESLIREELWEQIEADPATVEADAAWASCMAAAGYDAANPRELYLVVERELAWFLASDQPDEAELARAQNQEVQIALQGFDCEEPLRSTYRTVRLRYEEQFFNEHALLLATIRAEIEKVEP